MGTLVPLFEPLGYHTQEGEVSIENEGGTLLGWLRDPELFTTRACVLILISSVLGLLVNLSAMLVIQHTSTLTYNVVGHIKTVVVLAGGVLIFGDGMTLKKLTGITVTMTGIVWYSILKMRASAEAKEKEQALRAAKEEVSQLFTPPPATHCLTCALPAAHTAHANRVVRARAMLTICSTLRSRDYADGSARQGEQRDRWWCKRCCRRQGQWLRDARDHASIACVQGLARV